MFSILSELYFEEPKEKNVFMFGLNHAGGDTLRSPGDSSEHKQVPEGERYLRVWREAVP